LTDEVISNKGIQAVNTIQPEIARLGFNDPKKIYFVVYGGSNRDVCASSQLPGHVPKSTIANTAAIYYPGKKSGSCSEGEYGFKPEFNMTASSALHEIFHALGIVPKCAPDHLTFKSFGTINEVAEMPNLIDVQKASYEKFLVSESAGSKESAITQGLFRVFDSVFPISDFTDTSELQFVSYELGKSKYDVEECRQRGLTYAAPLRVKFRLIIYDLDEETGIKSVRSILEQDVYMGDMPLMTEKGTFVVNGTERVVVSQMHRSPGVFF
jgi:hypothetical protein